MSADAAAAVVAVVAVAVAVAVAAESSVVAFAEAIPVVAEPFLAEEHALPHMEGDLVCENVY